MTVYSKTFDMIGRQHESFDQFATRSRIRAPADHDKVVSKTAASDTIRVIAR
jgi:hypothetical protein